MVGGVCKLSKALGVLDGLKKPKRKSEVIGKKKTYKLYTIRAWFACETGMLRGGSGGKKKKKLHSHLIPVQFHGLG